jgi:hypothetical protein
MMSITAGNRFCSNNKDIYQSLGHFKYAVPWGTLTSPVSSSITNICDPSKTQSIVSCVSSGNRVCVGSNGTLYCSVLTSGSPTWISLSNTQKLHNISIQLGQTKGIGIYDAVGYKFTNLGITIENTAQNVLNYWSPRGYFHRIDFSNGKFPYLIRDVICALSGRLDLWFSTSRNGTSNWARRTDVSNLAHVTVDGKTVCGTTPGYNLSCITDVTSDTSYWTIFAALNISKIDLSNGLLCGLNISTSSNVLQCTYITAVTETWFTPTQPPVALGEFAMFGDRACGLGSGYSTNNIYCTYHLSWRNSTWSLYSSSYAFFTIDVTGDRICATTNHVNGYLIYCKSYGATSWVNIPGAFDFVSIGYSRTFAIDPNRVLFQVTNDVSLPSTRINTASTFNQSWSQVQTTVLFKAIASSSSISRILTYV